ncbi:MAG TPA: hypothetical protein VG326_10495 [Tepidisphaeraceae bacterium]|jgi:hypothetical protein|nr:hypothetical protein [Tepidisphaeraceae bacterium]
MLRFLVISLLLSVAAFAAGPSTRPTTRPSSDSDVDWLLGQAKRPTGSKQPDTPASQPSPFAPAKDPDVRDGTVSLSNGEKIHGHLSHTREKPVRVWIESQKEYRDIPFKLIARFTAVATSEYDEKEWHFKESGSDIKEFTGKSYPVREMSYTLTLVNGQTVTGGVVEPIYLERKEGPYTFSLLKRDKGNVGQTLKQLVYVVRIDFDDAKPTK